MNSAKATPHIFLNKRVLARMAAAAVLLAAPVWAQSISGDGAGTQMDSLSGTAGQTTNGSPISGSNANGQNVQYGPNGQVIQNGQNGALGQYRTGMQNVNGQQQTQAQGPAVPPRPTEFQVLVQQSTGRHVPIFGSSLFNGVPSTFAPVEQVPVDQNYVLGPGDQVNIDLAGQVNQRFTLTVDRTGAIAIPGLGPVHVAGLQYGDLQKFLTQQVSRLYRNFTLTATMGQLRSIQVFVVGQARRPGSYSISSLSTLLNAIFACGGPASNGSMRDIEVRRDGKVIDHFDLYDLLLHGDKSHDIMLMSGDVIFFPYVGPQVAVVGSVDLQGVYELKGKTTVDQALALAGGETPVASSSSVRLERIYKHSERAIEDFTLAQGAKQVLQDGDILTVTSIVDRYRNAVTLRGNVANPGRYVWHEGMRLSDLFPNKESLITRDYWRSRAQLGQMVKDYLPQPENGMTGQETTNQNLQTRQTTQSGQTSQSGQTAQDTSNQDTQAQQSDNNPAGQPGQNTGTNSTATGQAGGNSVGAALTQSNSIFQPKNDVLLSAPDIDWGYAVIERQSTHDLTTSLIPFNLGKLVLDHDASQNYELQPGDVVTIFSKADIRVPASEQTRFVRLEGEFVGAGVYSVLPGETLRELVRRAGGLTPDAYLYASEFTRESTRRVEQQRLQEYADELEAQVASAASSSASRAVNANDQAAAVASQQAAEQAVARLRRVKPIGRVVLDLHPNSRGLEAIPDIPLEDGDRFVVPHLPSSVNVEGEVYSPNAFLYLGHQRVIDYLKRAGGPNRDADKKRIFLLRADGSVVSRQYSDVLHAPIYPGDTIVVPMVLSHQTVMQHILDAASIASIVGNLGMGLGTIWILARQ